MSWNCCGLERDAITDVIKLIDNTNTWDAILLQEGPHSEQDSFSVLPSGHGVFTGACHSHARGCTIVLHQRWLQTEHTLEFKSLDHRAAFLDFC